MTAATDVQLAEYLPAGARQFPATPGSAETTLLVLLFTDDRLPTVVRVGTAAELDGDPAGVAAAAGGRGTPLLPEHWTGLTTRTTVGSRLSVKSNTSRVVSAEPGVAGNWRAPAGRYSASWISVAAVTGGPRAGRFVPTVKYMSRRCPRRTRTSPFASPRQVG